VRAIRGGAVAGQATAFSRPNKANAIEEDGLDLAPVEKDILYEVVPGNEVGGHENPG
jgi:hypothetical protein